MTRGAGEHTPEPWQINGSHIYGADPERELIAQCLTNHGRLVADRNRIVACVNALAGIPTDALDGLLDEVRGVLDRNREGWENAVEMGLLPPQHFDTARILSEELRTLLTKLERRP